LLRGVLDAFVDGTELNVGDGLAVDPHALVDANEMGRAVERSLVSGDAQDGRERCAGGAFAVGSGDEHAGKTALGIPQRRQHLTHIDEIELVGRRDR